MLYMLYITYIQYILRALVQNAISTDPKIEFELPMPSSEIILSKKAHHIYIYIYIYIYMNSYFP